MKYRIIAVAAIALLPTFALAQSNGSSNAGSGSTGHAAGGTHNQGDPDFSGLPDQPSLEYKGQMAEGQALDEGTYTYYPVPQYPDYDYLVLNGHHVVVDHKTHKIYRIIP